MTRTPLPRKPNRLDAIEGARDLDEQFLAMIVSLTSEVTVLRARLDAAERLLVKRGSLNKGEVDSFDPDSEAQIERDALRRRTMQKIFRPLHEAAQKDLEETERRAR